MKIIVRALSILVFFIALGCSTESVENYNTLTVYEDSLTYDARLEEIINSTPVEVATGLQVKLWATDSLAPDPVAMSIDDFGRVYLTRTNRQKNSEFDIRGFTDWMIESISLQSVEDRRAFLKKTFDPAKTQENSWLEDLNQDGVHDWKDLAVEQDEVWMLEDVHGNGVADKSTRIIKDFNEEITDVAGALLVRRNDMFIGIGPDMWRITDSNHDGKYDTKESISTGYAVHIGFSGHGMSGVVEGPDGKIYWGIGDIGASITAKDGQKYHFPNQGVLVRSNPDGSDFEVFAAGLRNTHEFAFDEYGNIIGADNDGDHPGERERLVYIVEGSDAGWRSNWQYGKYLDPLNNRYKVWMDEKLHIPRWDGQAAYIIPPIMNFHNGPTGMVYNPGTALGSKWRKRFFLVEFRGTPSASPIWSFSLKPFGASFELDEEEKVLSGVLPTGIRFGPDGALYAADWINGWDTKNYGRVWRLDVTPDQNDLAEERKETEKLMKLDYPHQQSNYLGELLFYPDMRIRQKAQFELANRTDEGLTELQKAIAQKENQLARIHGIWGIAQLVRAGNANAELLMPLLNDTDTEILAQTAKVLGEIRYEKAGASLVSLLNSNNPRAKFFAAQAIGRIGFEPAVLPLIDMIRSNADEDLYIRHAGVLALARIGDESSLTALSNDPEESVRLAAVLALRRIQSDKISLFLNDESEYIVTEAARAINDDWSIETALPDLASLLRETRFNSEPLLRRAINAASRVGGQQQIDDLIDFSKRTDIDSELRAEAILVLGNWASPSVLDRVDGRFRGEIKREDAYVKANFGHLLGQFFEEDSEIAIAAINATTGLQDVSLSTRLSEMARSHQDPSVRSASVQALAKLKYENLASVVKDGINDSDETVRAAALGLISATEIPDELLEEITGTLFKKGTIAEQQQMLAVLGSMPLAKTEDLFESLIDQWVRGDLSPGISLELVEAIDSSHSEKLLAIIEPHRLSGNTTEDFKDALYGGNARAGAWIYYGNPAAQCTRCHSMDDEPGTVGPSLANIGDKLNRNQLLEALIEPSARLAPGYGTVILNLKDGNTVSGILMEESASELTLKTSDAEPLEIAVKRIEKRQNVPSAMPGMASSLTKKQIRNLVEFLSGLKADK